jgi:hypothetical protein
VIITRRISVYVNKLPGFNRSHESLIAIDVDDNSHMISGNSSPDELNIRSTEGAFPSKYTSDTPSHGSTVRNNNPPIAPDGKNTEWANKEFLQVGRVKGVVAKIEAGDQPNKIDLRTVNLKNKNKMKTKVCPLSHPG